MGGPRARQAVRASHSCTGTVAVTSSRSGNPLRLKRPKSAHVLQAWASGGLRRLVHHDLQTSPVGRGAPRFTIDPSLEAKMHQYQIVGRAAPTNKNPTPKPGA